jgi:hypothetical protein
LYSSPFILFRLRQSRLLSIFQDAECRRGPSVFGFIRTSLLSMTNSMEDAILACQVSHILSPRDLGSRNASQSPDGTMKRNSPRLLNLSESIHVHADLSVLVPNYVPSKQSGSTMFTLLRYDTQFCIALNMERLFSPCTRLRDRLGSRGRREWFQEVNLTLTLIDDVVRVQTLLPVHGVADQCCYHVVTAHS